MYSSCDTPKGGFPHSEISGSKLICQLPEAYRRLSRPSSPVIAKASTTCTSSLDPITLTPVARHLSVSLTVSSICVVPFSSAPAGSRPQAGNSCARSAKCSLTQSRAVGRGGLGSREPGRAAPTALIRLYELLKNDSRSCMSDRTGQRTRYRRGAPCADRFELHFMAVLVEISLVEVNGIEPMTPCLQSRCSPS